MSNRLAGETSPYLLQHAANPVDWWPWGEAALEQARKTDKPILLSIGYSACHWCHVMAHESFEDAQVAALMNELFVNIKVDREERPDLDRVYQLSHQLLTRRPGGWPLTVFLHPHSLLPFFAGTYFPPIGRHGLPGFADVLRRIAAFYREESAALQQQTVALQTAFAQIETGTTTGPSNLNNEPLIEARRRLESEFDVRYGGFGRAPKFPQAGALELFLRLAAHGDAPAGRMALFTLEQMAQGGLYDQLGGGFFRYAVDQAWQVPHFEKMLYDNGSLLSVCARAAATSGSVILRTAAIGTADWALNEMRDAQGGFYASQDADTAGEEGGHYLWAAEDIRTLLPADDYTVFALHAALDQAPNVEGRYHLHIARNNSTIANGLGKPEADVAAALARAKNLLLTDRRRRPPPGRDEKILTSWNALLVRGLADAGRWLARPEYITAAQQAVDFIHRELWQDRRLFACHANGQTRFAGYLDDYAALADALLVLLQAHWRSSDLAFACDLADALLIQFEDRENGGFFFTAHHSETLPFRGKPFSDESLPAGNGLAARALLHLGHLLGRSDYLLAAERVLQAAHSALARYPQAHPTVLDALADWLQPPPVVIVRDQPENFARWQAALPDGAPFTTQMYCIPADCAALPEALALREMRADGVAYVCRGMQCSAPLHKPEDLQIALQNR